MKTKQVMRMGTLNIVIYDDYSYEIQMGGDKYYDPENDMWWGTIESPGLNFSGMSEMDKIFGSSSVTVNDEFGFDLDDDDEFGFDLSDLVDDDCNQKYLNTHRDIDPMYTMSDLNEILYVLLRECRKTFRAKDLIEYDIKDTDSIFANELGDMAVCIDRSPLYLYDVILTGLNISMSDFSILFFDFITETEDLGSCPLFEHIYDASSDKDKEHLYAIYNDMFQFF